MPRKPRLSVAGESFHVIQRGHNRDACFCSDEDRRIFLWELKRESHERGLLVHAYGTLWQGRFRSGLVGSESYVMACHRYIELNPVRAGLVEAAEQWQWSSYRANALGLPDELVTTHLAVLALASTAQERQLAYRQLFADELSEETLDRLRLKGKRGAPRKY